MRIISVDPLDRKAVAALHRIYAEVGHADNPDGFVEAPADELQEVLRTPTARFAFSAFLGVLEDVPVASGWCAFDIKDDQRLAFLTPRVLPAHRHQGYGSQMLEVMEHHAAAHGRTLFQTMGAWDAGHGPHGSSSAPVRFAASNGWNLALVNTRLRLELPSDPRRLDSLLAGRDCRRLGYSCRSWSGPVPDDLLSGWAVLHAAVAADAPHGELDQQTEAVDPQAIRDDERILRETGQEKIDAAAICPAGELVAFSSIVTRTDASEPALQRGTIVRRDHRGLGLGALVKVQALRLLERTRPDIPAVITENALDNEHMLALNRALGCVPVLYSGDFQKHTT